MKAEKGLEVSAAAERRCSWAEREESTEGGVGWTIGLSRRQSWSCAIMSVGVTRVF